MPAINYYIPETKYVKLVYEAHARGIKIKTLIDEALELLFQKIEVDKAVTDYQEKQNEGIK